MLKWQDGSTGEPGGGGGSSNTQHKVCNGGTKPAVQQATAPVAQQQYHRQSSQPTHPASPQRSVSSHDDCDQDINSNQSLLVSNRERSKMCKSSSALCSLLGRWSRSRPEIGQTMSNSSSSALYPPYPSSGALYPSSSALSTTALASTVLSTTMRKCQTLVSLSSPDNPPRPLPIHPYNRLRPQTNPTALLCSRCSSLLSMASSSKYSVNEGRYVSLAESSPPSPVPMTLCKLCLVQVPTSQTYTLQCSCVFCLECTRAYVEFEIGQGAYEISCPDAMCKSQGVINLREIENLVNSDTLEKHLRFRKNREVDTDTGLAWCPGAGCETVCTVLTPGGPATCPTCSLRFCSICRSDCHDGPCPRLTSPPPPLLAFDSDLIKYCPMCAVPIEKDEGCAQMMCKRCKHVFCWYCLTSLDDDFLLRHYDKGPCKNKLGHSRASVIWHRTQVIGIFAGFGILLLVASPLLLLAAPCIVCCKCRVCTGSDARIEDDNISPPPNEENSRETS